VISIPFIAAGAMTGAGLGLLVIELLPGPPQLGSALARVQATAPPLGRAPVDSGIRGRAGRYLVERHAQIPGMSIPTADLSLIGKSAEAFLFNKVAVALVAALFVPYLAVVALVAGVTIPVPFVLLGAVLLGAVFYVAADADVAAKAKRYRLEAEQALTAYLDLVALRRVGEAGITEALEGAAAMSDGWLFVRLAGALERARDERQTPWQGLRSLADELELPTLRDIADIVSLAGKDGAGIYNALRAKCAGMRTALGNSEAEAAATATVKLTMIGGLLALVLMVLVGFPAMARIMGT
jgi:hypothetical protein